VDPVPDPQLFLVPENRTRVSWICSQELLPLYHRGGLVIKKLFRTQHEVCKDLEKICHGVIKTALDFPCRARINYRLSSLFRIGDFPSDVPLRESRALILKPSGSLPFDIWK
jgi:hypothetical protein